MNADEQISSIVLWTMPGIREWFRGQTVLITGGTGFLGQALIYKLLQSGCPKIFLLIRPKRGLNAEQRLCEIIKRYTFDSLRDTVDIHSKLIAISCDSDAPGVRISDEDWNILQDQVTVVVHGAASVKFDDPLKKAIETNLLMTKEVIEMASRMKKLKMFSYISTAFSNCEYMLKGVEERLYEPKMNWRSMIEAADKMPEEMLNSMEKKLLGASPNTYVFTKHLAESLVSDYNKTIPIVIIRPPIVIASLKEPEPGWITNLNSPLAVSIASGKGVLRLYNGHPDAPKAYAPIDVVINGTMAIIWHEVTQPSKDVLPVYNTNYMPSPASRIKAGCLEAIKTHPMHNALWHNHFHFVTNRHLYLILHLLVHVFPGLVIDGFLKFTGQKPMLTHLYRKMYVTFVLLGPFLNISDSFHLEKFENVKKSIPEDEKEVFYLDLDLQRGLIDFVKSVIIGFRAFVGEPTEIQPKELVYQKRLYYLDLGVKYLFYLTILWHIPYAYIYEYVTAGFFLNFVSLFDVSDL